MTRAAIASCLVAVLGCRGREPAQVAPAGTPSSDAPRAPRSFTVNGQAYSIEVPDHLSLRPPDPGIAVFEESSVGRGMRIAIQDYAEFPATEAAGLEALGGGQGAKVVRSQHSAERFVIVTSGAETVTAYVLVRTAGGATGCLGIALKAKDPEGRSMVAICETLKRIAAR